MAHDDSLTDVYTDGACKGNPGPGGWGWITTGGRTGRGGAAQTTNQRMELQAVLEAVETLDGPLCIHSDSTYVVNCFNDRWYEGWLRRGWKNSQKKPVANRDLWEPLIDRYLERAAEVEFVWVKGHSGDEWNERADELAVAGAEDAAAAAAAAATGTEGAAAPDDRDGSKAATPSPTWPSDRAIWAVGTVTPDDDQLDQVYRAIDGLDPAADLVVSGLRRGTELLAAERAVKRGVPLAVVLPFDDPAASWAVADRERFDRLRRHAVVEITLPGDPSSPTKSVEQRNDWIAASVVGAIVVGAEKLAADVESRGVSVISVP